MNKKKTVGLSFAIFGIVFAIYNLIVFLFLKPETPVFWMSYGFMVLAFALQILGMYLSFKEFSVQAVFFGIPLAQFTLYYFFAELFMSAVFMIFQGIPWKIPVILQVILLAIYAVVAIVSVASRDATKASKDHYQNKATEMRLNTIDVEMLRDECQDPELKNQLRRLAEAVKYSDPMTNDFVADVDARIRQETFALQTYCQDGDVAAAKDSCTKLQRLYVERNKKLMASK
jgi:hypothetical protein